MIHAVCLSVGLTFVAKDANMFRCNSQTMVSSKFHLHCIQANAVQKFWSQAAVKQVYYWLVHVEAYLPMLVCMYRKLWLWVMLCCPSFSGIVTGTFGEVSGESPDGSGNRISSTRSHYSSLIPQPQLKY